MNIYSTKEKNSVNINGSIIWVTRRIRSLPLTQDKNSCSSSWIKSHLIWSIRTKGGKTKLGFVEVKMGTSHGHPKFSPNNFQSQRKRMYWDTMLKSQFMWWYTLNYGDWRSLRNLEGQMVVILSKIKLAKKYNFSVIKMTLLNLWRWS